MSEYILNLDGIKCPMNLVFVKNAVHGGHFANGGKILTKNNDTINNIINYLKLKGFEVNIGTHCIIVSPFCQT